MPFRFLTSALFLLTIQSFSFGQYIEKTKISKVDYTNFKEAKLYVVLDLLNSRYDSEIKKSVIDNWTYSEYEFIDTSDFRKLCDSANAFFFLVPCQLDISGGSPNMESIDRPDQHFIFLKIIRGNPRYFKYLIGGSRTFYPTGIASVLYTLTNWPRKLYSVVNKPKRSRHENTGKKESAQKVFVSPSQSMKPLLLENVILSILVRNLQFQCDNLVSGKNQSVFKRQRDIYKSNSKIHSTPLYILKSDLSSELKSLEDIKKEYSGEVRLISSNERDSLIREKKDVNILHCFSDFAYNYFRVFNAKTGEMIYLKRTNQGILGIRTYHLKHWEAAKRRSLE